MDLLLWPALIGLGAFAVAGYLAVMVNRQPVGTPAAAEISKLIKDGAMTYLNSQYRILAVYVAAVGLITFFLPALGWKTAILFVFGAVSSIISGNIGMRIATAANARTAQAVQTDVLKGLKLAFFAGSVSGLVVVGLGLLGVIISYWFFQDANVLFGYAFGASSVALFARVGGGIYTKAADVGADLVGKVEAGIPEDDPRNPAVIADNVGDNVGDVAGMGADLFETYVDSMIAAVALGALSVASVGPNALFVPMFLAAAGIIGTFIGNIVMWAARRGSPHGVMNLAIAVANAATALLSLPIILFALPGNFDVFWALLAGLVAGVIISFGTDFFTAQRYRPTRRIAAASETGPATNIIAGLAVGMISTAVPVLAVSAAILLAFQWAGLFGIAIAAIGMLASLGITLATDTFGPIADNAAGIAEMANLGSETRSRAEQLDAIGNSTAAIGKGFSVSAAALISLVLLITYAEIVGLTSLNLLNANVIAGLLLGGVVPFIFAALTMQSVGKAAYAMVKEVRRQFQEIAGLLAGTAKPDYTRCITISTNAALREMILPGLLAIVAPIAVGFGLGPEALGGFLAGSMLTGFLLAVFMANAGGAWDNAKKYIEAGNLGGKGSDFHKAAVVGDTVGDPFKDTSGPGVNILIKVVATVSIVIAPLLLLF